LAILDTDAVNSGDRLSRRRALGLLAGAGIAALAGCSSSGKTPNARTTTQPSDTPSGSTHLANLTALGRRLSGALLVPGAAGYAEAHRLFDPRFDRIHPVAIAQVATVHDVAQCVDFARSNQLPLSIRSGGHSYLGASTGPGLVIDVRAMNGVNHSHSARRATIGAGTALVDAYAQLAAVGVSIPAGSCPGVGLSGLTLGGGVGVVSREYGLTCDHLTSAVVVTADGSVVTCDANHHSDLFWALRGGGGSFGVVTELTYETIPATSLSHGYVAWPWDPATAADVLSAWQHFAVSAPDALWSTCHLVAQSSRAQPPMLAVAAVYVGASGTLDSLLDPLIAAVPATASTRSVNDDGYEATMMLEAGCADLTVASCHVADETPGGVLQRGAFVAGSDYFADLIPAAGISAIVSAVAARAADPALSSGGVSFDVLGGAVDRSPAGGAAYAHRGALFNAQYTANWLGRSNRPLARNLRSLRSLKSALAPYATGGAYPNYADVTLRNAPQAYWGANLPRLVEIRRTYDPTGLFTQPQGVPLH
jgi:FAD/FMN-containing dehydrogenase